MPKDNGDTRGPVSHSDDAAAWLAIVTELANDAIVGIDLSGAITFWNKAADVMFGYSVSDVVGRPIAIIYPSEELDDAMAIPRSHPSWRTIGRL